jgi:hypothetical protein
MQPRSKVTRRNQDAPFTELPAHPNRDWQNSNWPQLDVKTNIISNSAFRDHIGDGGA